MTRKSNGYFFHVLEEYVKNNNTDVVIDHTIVTEKTDETILSARLIVGDKQDTSLSIPCGWDIINVVFKTNTAIIMAQKSTLESWLN